MSLLLEKGLLELVFTTDGKEYLTNDHLRREIEDELYVNGGRINLVELSKSLCVDLQKIQPVAERIALDDSKVTLILGQLISSDYIIRIASEINERLSQNGEINVSELTGAYDLPSDFLLHEVVERNLGRIIFGKQDSSNPRLLYTSAFISRCKSRIRGALAGVTKPTPITALISQTGIQERIFFSLTNDVSQTGTITSRSTAGSFIPHIYTQTQSEWVRNFFKQNGYLEYESASALGVGADPKPFIQKQLSGEKLTFLNKCVVGQRIIDQVESTLEESIATSSFLDISTILPSIIGEQDIEKLIQVILTPSKQRLTQIFGSLILTTKYVDNLLNPVYGIAEINAKTSVDSGTYQKFIAEKTIKQKDTEIDDFSGKGGDKREDRRKKAVSGKAGGGAQGRETKTKSTKKHQRGSKNKDFDDSGSDEEVAASKKKSKDQQLSLISVQEIKKAIKENLENDGLEDLESVIANFYHLQVNKHAQSKAQELYETSLQNSMQNRKQNHSILQDRLNNLINDIRLYEKGLKMFSSTDTQTQLTKYLLKSLGTDFCNEIAFYIAAESELTFPNASSAAQLTLEQRNKIALECVGAFKQSLSTLNKSLNGSVEDFLIAADNTMAPCSMIVKKIDKKKDK